MNLDVLLARAHPSQDLAEKIEWLQDLIQWLRSPLLTNDERATLKENSKTSRQRQRKLQTVRLRYFLQLLERNPKWKENVAMVLRSILWEASAVDLFSSTGLNKESGFFSEASNRVQRRLLPAPADTRDFAALFVRIFRHESDPDWIRALPIEVVERVLALFRHEAPEAERVFTGLRASMVDALLILAPEISAAGLSPELRVRMDDRSIVHSPFYALNESLLALALILRGEQPDLLPRISLKILEDIAACRKRIRQVFTHLEDRGVSIALVYKLERITKSLDRVEVLLEILIPGSEINKLEKARDFTALLVDRSIESTKLRQLIGSNLDLISRKVVERVGFAGDHYIATTTKEYWNMFWKGGGGGIVTIFTVLLKTFVSHAGLPLFFEGLFYAVNFTASFLVIQGAHFALATKQPSMTATALANKLTSLSHRRQLDEFVNEVARITRTQFAAALGNVSFVVVGSLLFHLLYRNLMGHSLMDAEYAYKTIKSFNPFTSVTIPAAALTGVILWSSAVIGGWFENWAVFRRMPEAIATNRTLVSLFGPAAPGRFSRMFSHQIAGITSNVAIGFMLAFTPILGKFFGLPLDVRHVTLSSGSLTFAVASLGLDQVGPWNFAFACFGILVMFLLNFGVAYSLALFVALRARRIKRVWTYHLLKAVGRRFVTHMSEFMFPVRSRSNQVDVPK